MKIGTMHRNQIWRSMVELRNSVMLHTNQIIDTPPAPSTPTLVTSAEVQQVELTKQPTEPLSIASQSSTASDASAVSVTAQQNNGFNPGFYEVTRYTFKHTISIKKEDHDYC